MSELAELGRLLLGTVIHRPYVYGFFICFLGFALRQLRARGTLVWLVLAWCVAFVCEYSATRNGFPFGVYVYVDTTRTRELWISNVPFWDSLSFVFLSYFSWGVASAVRDPGEPARRLFEPLTAVLGGLLMMLLDVVIDPLTLLGDRWFLGRIYYYPNGGSYFGVTLANFAGWFFVGTVVVLAFQGLCRLGWVRSQDFRPVSRSRAWAAFGVYAGVFLFNLSVTAWIGEWKLFAASAVVVTLTCGLCAASLMQRVPIPRRSQA
jgi:uncharacterized membrane protein